MGYVLTTSKYKVYVIAYQREFYFTDKQARFRNREVLKLQSISGEVLKKLSAISRLGDLLKGPKPTDVERTIQSLHGCC